MISSRPFGARPVVRAGPRVRTQKFQDFNKRFTDPAAVGLPNGRCAPQTWRIWVWVGPNRGPACSILRDARNQSAHPTESPLKSETNEWASCSEVRKVQIHQPRRKSGFENGNECIRLVLGSSREIQGRLERILGGQLGFDERRRHPMNLRAAPEQP